MIEINNLTLYYDEIKFFNKIHVSFPTEKMNIILGQNGAGKTTLLKIIAGMVKPDEGDIKTNNLKPFYLPQKINPVKGLSLYEYISSIYYRQDFKWQLSKEEKNKIISVLEELELIKKKDIATEKLSAGEFQKSNIAIGLLSKANLLLLDEPAANMDLINQIKVFDMIKKLKDKNITTIITLHDVNLAAHYGDYFVGIDINRNIFSGNKENFFNEKILKSIYNIPFKITNSHGEYSVQISN